MNYLAAIGALAAITTAGFVAHGHPEGRAYPAAQPFRTHAEAVRVDVLVKIGNRPVAGLTAANFDLRDRGVPQQIDSVAFEDVPLSVMIALDTSDSLKGRAFQDLRDAASAAAHLLRTDDRAALLTFTHRLSLQTPWTREHAKIGTALLDVEPSGATSLHDVAYAALTLKDDQPGRALVLLFSDGNDTASWLSGASVIDAARRSETVVYAVGLTSPLVRAPGYRLDFRSGVQPPAPNLPPQAMAEPLLPALADETGGRFLTTDRSGNLRETFVQIVNEFRTRYLLTYTPRGVDVGGWHPIEVRLKKARGSATARRGYLK
jgi:Ca-activated chloride channel family protein